MVKVYSVAPISQWPLRAGPPLPHFWVTQAGPPECPLLDSARQLPAVLVPSCRRMGSGGGGQRQNPKGPLRYGAETEKTADGQVGVNQCILPLREGFNWPREDSTFHQNRTEDLKVRPSPSSRLQMTSVFPCVYRADRFSPAYFITNPHKGYSGVLETEDPWKGLTGPTSP